MLDVRLIAYFIRECHFTIKYDWKEIEGCMMMLFPIELFDCFYYFRTR